jgi:hypothetical protein
MTTTLALRSASARSMRPGILAAALLLVPIVPAAADDLHGQAPVHANRHAPIGVMGDHMHHKGEWMLSYRYMYMDMAGNRIGTDEVTPDEIVNSSPLRIVPTRMSMQMHMLGAMYAPTDNLTLMVMGNYLEKEMDHLTYSDTMNPSLIGGFTVNTEGWSDTKVTALYRLYQHGNQHVHLNLGLSLPTGSITEEARILAPNMATPIKRAPYAMQLGTGTFDLLPGLTYTDRVGDLSWGAQYRAEIRLEGENDEGYAWGDKHAVTGWLAYEWAPWISTSVRLDASTQGAIDGKDPLISGPVQTAFPQNYGGEKVELFGGINLVGQTGALRGHRLALEVGVPLYRNLNGPQLETDWNFTVGWQKAF